MLLDASLSRTGGAKSRSVPGSQTQEAESSEVAGENLKEELIRHVLPGVQTPAQYMGGEVNMVRKNHADVRGKLCLSFPDLYTIGMSHHGLQVLYSLMNSRDDWVCERAFAAWMDMEQALRHTRPAPVQPGIVHAAAASSTCSGFSLQYELCYPNILTMLDLAGIPLRSRDRTLADPLVIAGGPCAQNPEPLAPFIDVFVIGDGEPSLPRLCDLWMELKESARRGQRGRGGEGERAAMLLEIARTLPFCYVPRFYEPEYRQGRFVALNRLHPDVPDYDRAGGAARSRRHAAPHPAARTVHRVRARPDRHRDHARLSLAVPLLPKHGDQAAAARAVGGNDRQRRAGKLSQHRLQRRSPCCRFPPATIRTSKNSSGGSRKSSDR